MDYPDLILPPGSPPIDHLSSLVTHLLRDARLASGRLHDDLRGEYLFSGPVLDDAIAPGLFAKVRLLQRECRVMIQVTMKGTEQAIAWEREQAAAVAAEERRLVSLYSSMDFLGASDPPDSWTAMGWRSDDRLAALSRDSGLLILAAGIPGSGKTVFFTALCEAALEPVPGLTSPIHRRTGVAFFHTDDQDTLPQQLAGLRENPRERDLEILADRLGLGPGKLRRLNLVLHERRLPDLLPRLRPYQEIGLHVIPLKLHLSQLGQTALQAALGADTEAGYIARMLEEASALGPDLTIEKWHGVLDEADDLPAPLRRAAHRRLRLLGSIAAAPGGKGLWDAFGPDTMTLFSLGGSVMPPRDVLPLLLMLLHGIMQPSEVHGAFQRLIVADDVNRFDRDPLLWQHFCQVARMIRHRGSTLVLGGQDLYRVPDELFGLAGMCLVFRMRNPRAYGHIRERLTGLSRVPFSAVSGQLVGQAWVAVTQATDPAWQADADQLMLRPLRCDFGGHTRPEI